MKRHRPKRYMSRFNGETKTGTLDQLIDHFQSMADECDDLVQKNAYLQHMEHFTRVKANGQKRNRTTTEKGDNR